MDAVERTHDIERRRRDALAAAERYVHNSLLPALGLTGRGFRLELPGAGLRSLTYFVVLDSGARLVLRCVRGRDNVRWLAATLDLFAARGLAAPRQLHRDAGLWGHWRRGFSAFAEEFVPGSPAGPGLDAAGLETLGAAYGRVHAVEDPRAGPPHRLERRDVVAQRLDWARKLAGEGAAHLPGGGAGWRAQARALEATRPPLPAANSLCHNRVNRGNVIVQPGGAAVLVDLERVKFGSNLHELALLEAEVLDGSATAFASFLRGYAQTIPERLLPEAAPAAWSWHRRLVRLKRARDAAVTGDPAAASLLSAVAE